MPLLPGWQNAMVDDFCSQHIVSGCHQVFMTRLGCFAQEGRKDTEGVEVGG